MVLQVQALKAVVSPVLQMYLQRTKKEVTLDSSFYDFSVISISKPDKLIIIRKRKIKCIYPKQNISRQSIAVYTRKIIIYFRKSILIQH